MSRLRAEYDSGREHQNYCFSESPEHCKTFLNYLRLSEAIRPELPSEMIICDCRINWSASTPVLVLRFSPSTFALASSIGMLVMAPVEWSTRPFFHSSS